MYYGKGFPATVSSGFNKAIPAYGSFVSPGFGKFGKPFGKPFFGKGFAKPYSKGVFPGFPATKSSGFSGVVPSTTVVTTPFPGAI